MNVIICYLKATRFRFQGGNVEMEKNYEINDGTLAIISMDDGLSKVLEDGGDYVINQRSFDILDHSCKYFGSSYEGRKEGAKSIIGANYKLPIVVEDERNIVFFPTTSPEDKECIWIAVNKIRDYYEYEYNTTKVVFENGVELQLAVSFRAIQNQIFRATRLSYLLRSHKNR